MKDIIYCFSYAIPIIIMFIGLWQDDFNIVEKGFSLLIFIFFSYIGSCIKSIKRNLIIEKKQLLIAVILFVLAILILIYFSVIGKVIIGSLCCAILGSIAFYYLIKT